MDTEQAAVRQESGADKASAWIVVGLIFLLPIFLIPSAYVPFQFTKVMLMYIGVTAAFIAWIIARLKDGKLSFVKHWVFMSLGVVLLGYLIASIFSPVRAVSLVGEGFEISTFSFIAAMVLFLFLVSNLFVERMRTVYAYLAFLSSFAIVALYQLLRLLVGPGFLKLGVLNSATDNLVGSWNDLGVFFGAAALFSFITLELLKMERWMRNICIAVLAVSLFFLSVISFNFVWYILGGFALIFFIYNFSFNRSRNMVDSPIHSTDSQRTVPVISLIILIISFAFILFKGNIYSTLGNDLGIKVLNRFAVSNVEVRPSWTSTLSVAKHALAKHPLFGVGPNRFVSEWLQAKPAEVNSTIFWSTDFNYGIGIIPTLLVTTGIVGFLTWLVFLALFLYMGFKALFNRVNDSLASYLSISSFLIALYLWIFMVIHVPSAPIIVLTFAFTGIFFASVAATGMIRTRTFDIIRDPRTSFVSVLVLIGVLLGVVVFGYDIGKKYIASVYFNKALAAANGAGNIPEAELNISRALRFNQDDVYYRTLSQLNLIKINQLVSQQNLSQDILKNQFQAALGTAQAAAQAALSLDKTKYENWVSAGSVYEAVVPFNFKDAYEQALASYKQAQVLNPLNPALPLIMARLEVAHSNVSQAKTDIGQAIQMKNDYTDAIYMLAQIQINEGDLKSAIQSVEALTYTNPNDPGIYFQLGFLRYNNKDYTGAASAFEQAIALAPDYANAKYFLGLSYSKLNKDDLALAQFKALQASNPSNTEIRTIVNNLTAGKDAFANVPPPNNTPEKRSTPPVKETTTKTTPETADR